MIEEAARRAATRGKPVLVTVTERVDAIDALQALERAALAAGSDDLARQVVDSGCMYWERPSDGVRLAAIGSAITLTASGATRFPDIATQWASIVGDAVVAGADREQRGVGPVLLGGFSFDPRPLQSYEWSDFPGASLIVPRLLVTTTPRGSWLTTATLVGTDGVPDFTESAFRRLRVALASEYEDASAAGDDSSLTEAAQPADAAQRRHWHAVVTKALGEIESGRLRKVVLARTAQLRSAGESGAFRVLRHLRAAHRDAFVFGIWRGSSAFVGATPERLARVDGNEVRSVCLAGTARRGATAAEDARLSAGLLGSAKDRAEHAAVRDAILSGLHDTCDAVVSETEPSLLSLTNVHHLKTDVRARLKPGLSLLDVVARLHPTPAVGGTPRDAALDFIRKHEGLDRGWYAAPVGWMDRGGGEFAVALRSAIMAPDGATLYAGCGIVAGSEPVQEMAESEAKLAAMRNAIASALVPGDEDSSMSLATSPMDDDEEAGARSVR